MKVRTLTAINAVIFAAVLVFVIINTPLLLESWYLSRLNPADEAKCRTALSALSRRGSPRVIKSILQLGASASQYGEREPGKYGRIINEVLASLNVMGEAAVPELLRGLEAEVEDESVLASCALVQLEVGIPAIIEGARGALRNDKNHVRCNAIWILGMYSEEAEHLKVIDDLAIFIGDYDKNVRIAALEAIGRTGGAPPCVLERVRTLRNDQDGDIRKAAEEALSLLADD